MYHPPLNIQAPDGNSKIEEVPSITNGENKSCIKTNLKMSTYTANTGARPPPRRLPQICNLSMLLCTERRF